MTALFCAPLPFTVVSATEISTAPAMNAGLDEPGLVWRATGGGSVVIDLGPDAVPYDTVAVVGSNLRSSDTVQVSTGTSSSGTGGYSGSAVAAFTGTKPNRMTTKTVIRLGATRTDRYVRVVVAASGHPDGFSQVQRIVVGKSITTLGIDYDCEQAIIDPSNIDSRLGYDIIEEAAPRMRWKFSMGWVDAASWRAEWMSFLMAVGRVKPILFVPFIETPETITGEAIFGRFRNDVAAKATAWKVRSLDCQIESLAP